MGLGGVSWSGVSPMQGAVLQGVNTVYNPDPDTYWMSVSWKKDVDVPKMLRDTFDGSCVVMSAWLDDDLLRVMMQDGREFAFGRELFDAYIMEPFKENP